MIDNDTKEDDPIVAEVRRAREAMFARYGHDFDALVADMQRRTEESRRAGRRVVVLPPRRPQGWAAPAKKAG